MLTDSVKERIQTTYSALLKSKGYKPRGGQRQMIAAIARVLGSIETDEDGRRVNDSHLCMIEAGTGTGKTLAYIIASLPLALEQNKTLVVSTATVLLQEQLVGRDLPDLLKHSGLGFSFSLAKGRGRYLCQAKLERVLAQDASLAPNQALFADEAELKLEPKTLALLQEFQTGIGENTWDGDKDSWPAPLAQEDWQKVTTDHQQCTNRSCQFFQSCSYFLARQEIERADVVVANHDLVLADLALGGGVLLPAPEQSIYVFDEAHHLPDKVLQHFKHRFSTYATKQWLAQLQKFVPQMATQLGFKPGLSERLEQLPQLSKGIEDNTGFVGALFEELLAAQQNDATADFKRNRIEQNAGHYRFAKSIPPELGTLAMNLAELFSGLALLMQLIEDYLTVQIKSLSPDARETHELALSRVTVHNNRAQAAQALWLSFKTTQVTGLPLARWFNKTEQPGQLDYEVFSSPITASGLLPEMLWNRCHAAVMTSATLSALNRFDRIQDALGLAPTTFCQTVASPFDYRGAATLEVPSSAIDPTQSRAYESEIAAVLTDILDTSVASLVVFTARQQLQKVYALLKDRLQSAILLQDDYSKRDLIAKHCERVDGGSGSIIFGLASMTEGVDLPGNYVNHVVIVKLPFAVPDDPVAQTLSDWLESQGKNPFWEISVPDAALKLKQTCGRLLRSETDSGRISLLDKRVLTKRYGKALLDSLPDYRRVLAKINS